MYLSVFFSEAVIYVMAIENGVLRDCLLRVDLIPLFAEIHRTDVTVKRVLVSTKKKNAPQKGGRGGEEASWMVEDDADEGLFGPCEGRAGELVIDEALMVEND